MAKFGKIILISILMSGLFAGNLYAQEAVQEGVQEAPKKTNKKAAIKESVKAAKKWLTLVDKKKIQDNWNSSASPFRRAITVSDWKVALKAVRKPYGKFISRKLVLAKFDDTIPGVPGEFVIMIYTTVFKKNKYGIEQITTILDDGKWKVSGYLMR